MARERTMKEYNPFSNHEWLAFLIVGFALLFGLNHILHWEVQSHVQDNVPLAVMVVIASLVVGHLVDMSASFLFESLLFPALDRRIRSVMLGRVAGSSRFFPKNRNGVVKRLFPAFLKPLSKKTVRDIEVRASDACQSDRVQQGSQTVDPAAGTAAPGGDDSPRDLQEVLDEALFFKVRVRIRRDEVARIRMDNFQGSYGFCKNASFAALVLAAVVVFAGWPGCSSRWVAVVVLTLVSGGRFLRFLKYRWYYHFIGFTTFANHKDI
jgi:hypothetical protein